MEPERNTACLWLVGLGTTVTALLGQLAMPLYLLALAMVLDYCTGLAAAARERKVNSRIGLWGIAKKVCYLVVVAIGWGIDWVIRMAGEQLELPYQLPLFALLVSFWLIVNELISILENLSRLEVPLPPFLLAVAQRLKITLEQHPDPKDPAQ